MSDRKRPLDRDRRLRLRPWLDGMGPVVIGVVVLTALFVWAIWDLTP